MRAYERLIAYTKYPTASDEHCPACPSSAAQMDFAKVLVRELLELGVSDAFVDEHGYVYGTILPTPGRESEPCIGLIAHMDVVQDVLFENIKTRVVAFDGESVELSPGIFLKTADYPVLAACKDKHLVVTDGKTLLGADDKAGIADIMTLVEILKQHPEYEHGRIRIGFTPDEEIGRGADLFDVQGFGAQYAYTLDGGTFGEVEFETFNAASLEVSVHGVSTHPGSGYGRMKNASLIAMEYNGLLPALEKPEYTRNYEGFYHLTDMHGEVENAELQYILRDHDAGILEQRKETARKAAEVLNARYGEGTVEVRIIDSYRNMAEIIKEHWYTIERAENAIRAVGGKPHERPVRGGTDGCKLSFMGLPCPNIGTGAMNGHGRFECACVEQMDSAVEMLRELVCCKSIKTT